MEDKYTDIPQYVNVSTMARLLYLSRSRLYQLMDQGILLKPVYVDNNKRPVYTKEMAVRNLDVKHHNVGVNGEIVMFYSARNPTVPIPKKTVRKLPDQDATSAAHTDLIDALQSLGLENTSSCQIESAIQQCFPDGTANVTDDDILTSIFRYIKRQNTEHKPRT